MSNLASRILVGIVGLPVVLGLVWLGGWWLFGLVTVAGLVGVHEFVTMARPLRPLAPAAYLGVVLALVGARTGGVVWMLAGFLATFVLGFVLDALAKTRAPSTAALGSTILGSAWIGLGLGHLLLLRQLHDEPRLIAFTVLLTVWAADTFAYVTGRLIGRHKLAPRLSPAKTWEGLVGGSLAGIFVSFVALYDTRSHYLTIWQALVLGEPSSSPPPPATSSNPPSNVTWRSRTRDASSEATAASSTAQTPCSSRAPRPTTSCWRLRPPHRDELGSRAVTTIPLCGV